MENKIKWAVIVGILMFVLGYGGCVAITPSASFRAKNSTFISGMYDGAVVAGSILAIPSAIIAFSMASLSKKTFYKNTPPEQATLGNFANIRQAQIEEIDGQQLWEETIRDLRASASGEGCVGVLALGGWLIGAVIAGGIPMLLLIIVAGTSPLLMVIIGGIVVVAIVIFLVQANSGGVNQAVRNATNPKARRETELEIVKALEGRGAFDHEEDKIRRVIMDIAARGGAALKGPTEIVVVPKTVHYSETIGETVFVSEALLTNERSLAGALAHELGRIQNQDGIAKLSIACLEVEELPHQDQWSTYFQQQTYKADEFAVKYGFGRELIYSLERKMATPNQSDFKFPFRMEPHMSQRIDRLQKLVT